MFKQLSNRVEDHNSLIELYKEELAETKIEV